jgi:hypothetical protein
MSMTQRFGTTNKRPGLGDEFLADVNACVVPLPGQAR